MSEIGSHNNWWKLEDSWKTIVKLLPLVFIPFIGVAILLFSIFLLPLEVSISIFLTLFSIALITITIGFIPYFILFVNEIGNAIKLSKIKNTLPKDPEYKKIFAYYLVYILAPIVGPLFWSKAINKIMKYLGTQKTIQKDIEYVENRGKKYGILGMILWISYFYAYFFNYIMLFLSAMDKIIVTNEFLEFLIIFFSIVGGIMLILGIIMVLIQIGIINRLIKSIHESGLY